MLCYSKYTNENDETFKIVEINNEINKLAFKIACLSDNSNVNFKPIFDLIPINTLQNSLCNKIENILSNQDDDGDENMIDNTTEYNIDFSHLLGLLGQYCSELIFNDIQNIRLLYQDKLYFSTMDTVDFIKNRDKNVLNFLLGLTRLDLKKTSQKTNYALACVIESIYHLRNSNIVLPHSFLSNLVQFYTSGSKVVPVINGKLTPAGSYFTVHNWMSKRAEHPLSCPEGINYS